MGLGMYSRSWEVWGEEAVGLRQDGRAGKVECQVEEVGGLEAGVRESSTRERAHRARYECCRTQVLARSLTFGARILLRWRWPSGPVSHLLARPSAFSFVHPSSGSMRACFLLPAGRSFGRDIRCVRLCPGRLGSVVWERTRAERVTLTVY